MLLDSALVDCKDIVITTQSSRKREFNDRIMEENVNKFHDDKKGKVSSKKKVNNVIQLISEDFVISYYFSEFYN